MERGDKVSKVGNHYNDLLFSFSTSSFQSFFVFRMIVEESVVGKLQRQSKEKLQKLKEEQEGLRKQKKLQTFCLYSLGLQKEVHFSFSSLLFFFFFEILSEIQV
jgi:hypothetical protein